MKLTMYFWAFVLIVFLAAFAMYFRGEWTLNFPIAVATAALLDIAVKKFFLKREIRFPWSAAITGGIVGGIAPFNAEIYIVVLAAGIAIASKYLIRLKGSHVFNPATFGLVVALTLFWIGDEWWIATSSNVMGQSILLTPLLVIASYKANRHYLALTSLLVLGLLAYFFEYGYAPGTLSSFQGILSFLYILPYFLAFIMVSEPKTSPHKWKEQLVYGVLLAGLMFAFAYNNLNYYLLIPLLIGNAGFALYKNFFRKTDSAS